MINTIKPDYINFISNINKPPSMLIELIKEGVMLVSQNLQPVYLNSKAREISQQLRQTNYHSHTLPPVISDIYYRLTKNLNSEDKIFIMEYKVAEERTIRIRACNLNLEVDDEFSAVPENRRWVLFFLEDRSASLQEELWIEQKKYDLTERETEILNFLSQAYTYQEIANLLQISLNTVKFHVKNIYAKKRDFLGKNKISFEIKK
ncbi:helix-turn-helix transcriptional regulator [Aetokthonos hydrillicola Thurmond2011]|uniref:Helix-turn-helix transcriptional regulator n=1 Tax=Aetokthonos hydrillicola Thurmond2011 TaxID=2712845 RepID=A0AAP5I5N1_9CYAN|nr:helix-turn-helix transcriptional regulator [Aetokthonos hydrillicola]MBO3462209.1 helix-turn-helix transcriptional regulator [Aetokthonos hydrillicola CCALA 1050]MBW4585093.1 helix-turn-helix transcriptional regulator [Aetokthonos hydrillicola CCALA 1050]MDR9894147.1 helix-turn-helix transcriptional regulator [Aetokthonos hydrillicola Thurmond2011]